MFLGRIKDDLYTVNAKVYTQRSFSVFTGGRGVGSKPSAFLYVSKYEQNKLFYRSEQRFYAFSVIRWMYTLNALCLQGVQSVSISFHAQNPYFNTILYKIALAPK